MYQGKHLSAQEVTFKDGDLDNSASLIRKYVGQGIRNGKRAGFKSLGGDLGKKTRNADCQNRAKQKAGN